jgi:hypothetical protein
VPTAQFRGVASSLYVLNIVRNALAGRAGVSLRARVCVRVPDPRPLSLGGARSDTEIEQADGGCEGIKEGCWMDPRTVLGRADSLDKLEPSESVVRR